MKMALQLVRDMTGKWKPGDYADKFTGAIHALAAQRVKAGKNEKVTSLEGEAAPAASNVVDLTELLKKSLSSRKSGGSAADAPAPAQSRKAGAKKTTAKTAKTKRAA
jgi:DNA end-binding protein Ku